MASEPVPEPSPLYDREGADNVQACDSTTPSEPAKEPGHKSAKELWKSAGLRIRAGIAASKGLTTLRDQYGVNEISLSSLKILKKLGEGAFATVEMALYTPPADLSRDSTSSLGGGGGSAPAGASPASSRGNTGTMSTVGPPGAVGLGVDRGVKVAVKRLKPDVIAQSPDDLAAFVQEVALMRKLRHKHIVGYIGIGSADQSSEKSRQESMFLVQEFVGGGTLKKLVMSQMTQPHSRLYTHRDALRWVIGIADALAYMHSANPVVIHRDLKLENVLLTEGDRGSREAKLADFGLVTFVKHVTAKRLAKEPSVRAGNAFHQERSWQRTITKGVERIATLQRQSKAPGAGMMGAPGGGGPGSPPPTTLMARISKAAGVGAGGGAGAYSVQQLSMPRQLSGKTGTLMYMAPEMYRMEKYDERVDVFSFAVIMYEVFYKYMMICAVSIAGTEDEIDDYAHRVSEGFRPPLGQSMPPEVRELISDCWEQDPVARPNMRQVLQRLRDIEASGVLQAADAAANSSMGCGCTIC